MAGRYAAVLDTAALLHFAAGPVQAQSVAELLAEVRAEGRRVAAPAGAFVDAYAAYDDDKQAALLEWLASPDSPTVEVTPLDVGQIRAVADLMREFGLTASNAHAVHLALVHGVPVATADPSAYAAVFDDPDWDLLDLSQPAFDAGGGQQRPWLTPPESS